MFYLLSLILLTFKPINSINNFLIIDFNKPSKLFANIHYGGQFNLSIEHVGAFGYALAIFKIKNKNFLAFQAGLKYELYQFLSTCIFNVQYIFYILNVKCVVYFGIGSNIKLSAFNKENVFFNYGIGVTYTERKICTKIGLGGSYYTWQQKTKKVDQEQQT